MHDPLQHLLQQTDRALAAPPRAILAETLLAASRHRRADAKRRRIASVGVTAALASVAVAFTMSSRPIEAPRETRAVAKSGAPAPSDIPAPRTVEELRQEIAALEREAAWRTQVTGALTKDDNLRRLSALSSLTSFAKSESSAGVEISEILISRRSEISRISGDLGESSPHAVQTPTPSLNPADWLRVESARTAALSWQYANMAETEFHDLAAARREYQRVIDRFPGTAWALRSQVSLERILTSHKTPL